MAGYIERPGARRRRPDVVRREKQKDAVKKALATPGLLTKTELADYYGVTTKTIENWTTAGKIPAPRRIGTHYIRWNLADIEAFELAS